jgi:hypothetical protein
LSEILGGVTHELRREEWFELVRLRVWVEHIVASTVLESFAQAFECLGFLLSELTRALEELLMDTLQLGCVDLLKPLLLRLPVDGGGVGTAAV